MIQALQRLRVQVVACPLQHRPGRVLSRGFAPSMSISMSIHCATAQLSADSTPIPPCMSRYTVRSQIANMNLPLQ